MKFEIDLNKIGGALEGVAKGAGDIAGNALKGAGDVAGNVAKGVGNAAGAVAKGTGKLIDTGKNSIVNAIDANGDGNIDIEDIIILGLKIPGVRIERSEYLHKELSKNYPEDVINDVIEYNPAYASIPSDEIDKIADEAIKYERNCVSGISAALGMPGGVAMAATIPTDIAQYYGYMLRITQKLLYLYGFPEIDVQEKGQKFDSETMNILIICMGTMYGVAGANNAIKTIAKALANGVEKKLLNKALTKGTIYPIVKSVASWFGKKMTKEIFAGFFKKAIPVVGGVVGGGITYLSFKPCCDKLKDSLKDTMLSNPNGHNMYEVDFDLEFVDGEMIDEQGTSLKDE